MRAYLLASLLLLAGCLNTQNRKIEIKSKSTGGVSSVNSGINVEANPKDPIEKEVEYFNEHPFQWGPRVSEKNSDDSNGWKSNDWDPFKEEKAPTGEVY